MPRRPTAVAPLATALLVLLSLASTAARAQSAAHIDPTLGVDGGGNVTIGPALPYGMAKPGPDMAPGTANAGWNATGDILGFSQTHVSGTGGTAKYGNILLLPTTGPVAVTDVASPRSQEHASAGSETNLYIAGATWNGHPLHRSWFTHDELMRGGTLVLRMASHPTHWDTGTPPPSLSDAAPSPTR